MINDKKMVRHVLDSNERLSRKMQLDLVDKLIDINRKLNQYSSGRLVPTKKASWGIQEVADAVRRYDSEQALVRREAELDKKIKELKECLNGKA